MEFKVFCLYAVSYDFIPGINRIRLEFKDEENGRQFFDVIVLIESDWNLKQTVNMAIRKKDTVLIESDWNLKLYESNCFCNCEIVLIESDWNLKSELIHVLSTAILRINRIRLEFKVCTTLQH